MRSQERVAAYSPPRLRGADERSGASRSRLGWVLPALCLLFIAAMSIFRAEAVDLWWQLKTGELIWSSRAVPQQDVFSHTAAGQPWYVQEWLAELLLFVLYRAVSPEAVVVYKVLGALVAFGLVMGLCRLRCGMPGLAASVTALAAYSARGFLDMRPQLLTYVLFALSLLVLEQWRRDRWPRAIWLLPAITLLWVNAHGGFMLMFALLAVAVAAESWDCFAGTGRPRRIGTLAVVTGGCALAGLINPRGWDTYHYAFLLLGHQKMLDDIVEWWSPNFHDVWNQPLGAMLLLLAFSWAAARRTSAFDLLLALGLVHSALYSNRHGPLFAIACAPMIAERLGDVVRQIQGWMAERRWSYARLSTAAAIAVGLLLSARIVVHAREFPRGSWFAHCTESRAFPARACDFLMAQPGGGQLLNQYAWGGYCIWRLAPRYRVFIDGRAEVYFQSGYTEYHDVEAGKPGWEETLRRYRVDTVLVRPDSLVARLLAGRPEWPMVYQDDQAAIFRLVSQRAADARAASGDRP